MQAGQAWNPLVVKERFMKIKFDMQEKCNGLFLH